jgi:hypothetical protein
LRFECRGILCDISRMDHRKVVSTPLHIRKTNRAPGVEAGGAVTSCACKTRTRRWLSHPVAAGLSRVFGFANFAENGDLDLTGVLQIGFDLLGHVPCKEGALIIVQPVWLDDDADFTTCLNCEGLLDSFEPVGDAFECFESLDV